MKKTGVARCFRWMGNMLVTLLVTLAFILTLSRVLVVVLAHHRGFIETWASSALKRPIRIGSIKADWLAWDPGVTFEDVLLKDAKDQHSIATIKHLTMSIAFFRSLMHWKLLPGRLTIEGVNLDIDANKPNFQMRRPFSIQNTLNWLLSEGNIVIRNVNVNYRSKDKKTYRLHNIHMRIDNNFFTHRISGGAVINASSPTALHFVIKLSDIDFVDAKSDAKVYIQLDNLHLDQWANSIGLKPYLSAVKVHQGRADIALWGKWQKTKFVDWQGRWRLKNLASEVGSANIPVRVSDMLGHFAWHVSNHRWETNVVYAKFFLPKKYRFPFLMHDLQAEWQWDRDDLGVHVYVPHYQFKLTSRTPAIKIPRSKRRGFLLSSRGALYLTVPKSGEPTVDFLSSYQLPRFSQFPLLIPDRQRSARLDAWLKHAFTTGGIEKATVVYRGPIKTWPFQAHKAHLSAELRVRNSGLNYAQGWPELSELNGNVEVNDRRISASFPNALLGKNKVQTLQANLDDFLRPILHVKSLVHADLANVYPFFQNSATALLNLKNAKGPVHLNGQLQIDFTKPSIPIQSQGEARVINSLLKFQVRAIHSKVRVVLNGHVGLNTIKKHFPLPALKGVSGKTNYHAMIDIDRSLHHQKVLSVNVTTNMKGINISGFPVLIDKTAEMIKPLTLHLVVYRKKPMRLTLQYQRNLFMRLFANYNNNKLELLSGEIYVGKKLSPEYPAFPGFVIYGHFNNFHWEKWKPLIVSLIHEKKGAMDIPKIFGLRLRYVELQFDRLIVFHQTLHNMYFKLVPRLHDWMFQMNSPQVTGTLFIPNYSGGTWAGQLDHLNVPAMASKKPNTKKKPWLIDPRSIPPIDLEIKQFHYGKTDYGRVGLSARPNAQGLLINRFSIDSSLLKLNITGKWAQHHHQQSTTLSGYLKTQDLGRLLSNWGFKDTLLKGQGNSRFQLSWSGAPNQMKPKNLSGTMMFDFRRGRLLKMDESKTKELSVGRLVNAFSLKELPRWLSLHFGDITEKGLEFYKLKGNLSIKKGLCKMKKTLFDGPVAKLTINGVINFPAQYYDLDVAVAPYVTSSLPLIVGLAGGPIAGVVAWLVNKIAAPEIGKAIGFVYHAKGSWDKQSQLKLPIPAETIT